MYTRRKKPSVVNYVVASLIMVGGVVGCIVFLISRLSVLGEQPTYLVPGTHTLECTEAGFYTIFHEYQTVVDGKYYSSPPGSLTGLTCTVISETDDTLQVTPLKSKSTYSFGSREGYGILKFKVETPGTYTFEAILPEGHTDQAVLTISHGFVSDILFTIFGAMGILFGCGGVGLIIIVLTIIKQIAYNKEQRQLQQGDSFRGM